MYIRNRIRKYIFICNAKQKRPRRGGAKNLQQKRRRLLGGVPRSHRSLAMTFQSLTATTGERRDCAGAGHSEPPSRAAAGCRSTVYRGVLSESQIGMDSIMLVGLNPLYIVECFRREYPRMQRENRKLVLIHCVSWNAFGVVTMLVRDDRPGKS